MIRDPQKRRSLASAPNTDKAQRKNSNATLSQITREILGTLLAAAIFAASVWTSVFGMTGQFGPTQEVGYMLAEVNQDGR